MFSSLLCGILPSCMIFTRERVIMDYKSNTRKPDWDKLTLEEKNHQLFLQQKETLDTFLAHGAITKAQHDKSLGDLREKMGEKD